MFIAVGVCPEHQQVLSITKLLVGYLSVYIYKYTVSALSYEISNYAMLYHVISYYTLGHSSQRTLCIYI